TFDSFTEGSPSTIVSDGGITFSNLQNGLSGPKNFVIDADTSTELGASFSPPNVLGFGGFVSGQCAGFRRIHSMDFQIPELADLASLDLWHNIFFDMLGNTVSLIGLSNGQAIASQTLPIDQFNGVHHLSMSVGGGLFDAFRLQVDGPSNSG